MANETPALRGSTFPRDFLLALVCLAAALAVFFSPSFQPGETLFSNDGPLGTMANERINLPGNFFGIWEHLNWLGYPGLNATPNISTHAFWVLGPINFSRFYGPFSLLFLGLSAWLLMRQLRFNNWVGILAGLAAALNANTFSNVCWGLSARSLVQACTFLALAALVSGQRRRPLWKALLAGLAVGMGIMEGFDVGAIFSLYVAMFAVFLAWNEGEGSPAGRIFKGVGRVAVVAAFAAFVAAYTMSTLIGTQIKGVAGMGQDTGSKERRWAEATAWSTPPSETFRVLIPGVFGYRMDTAEGGQYWGTTGRQQDFEKTKAGFPRHSGSGEYAGVLVVLVALWAVALSFRRQDGPFTDAERRFIWFTAGLGFLSLLFAWGYHAPFYRLLYALPFFSTIRNPMKFMHPFHLAVVILFGFGLQALARRHLDDAKETGRKWLEQLKNWWATSQGFEKKWTVGSFVAVGAAFVGWLLYSATRGDLIEHLKKEGFGDGAAQIARFSYNEVALFILVLALAVAWMACVLAGVFTGRRAKWAALIAGLFLVVDFGRANKPWIVYYNYREKLASNAVLDFLRERPHEHRVAMAPLQLPPQLGNTLGAVYSDWLQNNFPYYNIQSLDIIQMPRQPEDMVAYNNTVRAVPVRWWQLSNTRYFLTATMATDYMNQQFDPAQRRFRVHAAFDFAPKAGLTAASRIEDLEVVPRTNGNFALIEFTGALPRAKLYSHWQTPTNDQAALQTLINPAFDPEKTVLVSAPLAPPQPADAAQPAGEVKITQYKPTKLRLEAASAVPTVLLLNDRHSPDWKVWVDGKPDTVLRCNYIVRGVALPAGRHEIEFRFEPPVGALWVSVAALAISLGLGLFLLITAERPAPLPPPAQGAGKKQ
ncbi:MAG: hypothetical protein HZA89_13020 [Verrucomicrobia bacterium]|nr:hypothetical protein [Verrucomicrobiota bacterium]